MPINLLDSPVPGQSLTQPKGAAPYEHPPKFVTPEEALDFLFDSMTEKKKATQIVLLLKNGVTCEYIARTVLFAGFMGAMWNTDLMLLIAPTVMYQIATIGEMAGVKNLKVKSPDKQYEEFLDGMLKTAPEEVKVQEEVTESIFSGLGKDNGQFL